MKRTLLFLCILFLLFNNANATIYTVNTNSDASTGSGTTGTLRWCITQANTGAGKDTINFALTGGGPYTFTVASNYPVISNPLYINGTSQTGYVAGQLGTSTRVLQIILNGPGNNTVYGFQITASNCEISGLVIQDFYKGIYINGGDNNWIWGCYIGTESNGLTSTDATACFDDGIALNTNANNNIIGTNGNGTNDANEGNCIGGNGDSGSQYTGECIAINEGGSTGNNCTGNIIAGNYLGINENGTTALYFNPTLNAQRGSGIHIANSTANLIGTNADGVSDALERNVISGNSDAGVVLQGSSSNKVKGNYIGTNKTGLVGVPNYGNGGTGMTTNQVVLRVSSLNNFVGTDGDGVGDNLEGNVIGSASVVAGGAGSYSDGIDIVSSSTGNRVSGNYIGIGADGVTALSILTTGITVNDYAINVNANSNIIGTNGDGVSDAYEANYIGNSGSAIVFTSVAGGTAAGNYIGLGTNLTTAAPLGYAGVYVINSTSVRVGSTGSNSLERNYICNSSQYGVWIDGSASTNNDLINIKYNFIGIRPDNSKAPNGKMGVHLYNRSNADTIQNNTIAYNGTASSTGLYPAIQIGETPASAESVGNVIKNNTIYKNIGAAISIIKTESNKNKISQNSVYNNGNTSDVTAKLKLGIDLQGDNVNLNDDKDPDNGSNHLMNFPIITGILKVTPCTVNIFGTLNAKTNETFTIEVFSSDVCNGDTSGTDNYANAGYNYGEGRTYLGSTTCTTDGNGNASWNLNVTPIGNYFTATSTMNTDGSTSNSTSEFSLCFMSTADMGDAPDTYRTLLASCGPAHMNINTNLKIGSTIDDDGDGVPTVLANGDGTDEDGISILPVLTVRSTSYTLTNIPVTNTTGSAATLYAWIDFNVNGSFELSEFTSATVANGVTSITLTWNLASFTCNSTIVVGISYMRLRLTTDVLTDNSGTSGIDERSYGIGNNGEVEDYRLSIYGLDYGDLSNTYPTATMICYDDTATAKVWAGVTIPDRECTQNYSADATGDGSEEDGLTTAIAGFNTTSNWVIRLNANQANKTVYYGLWLDWNGNGSFIDAIDAFYNGSAVVNGVTNVNVSVYAPNGLMASGFRLIVSEFPLVVGMYNATITNGEIEDFSLLRILESPANILTGSKYGIGNLLKWKTNSTISATNYVIERSKDNLSWTTLGSVMPGSPNLSNQFSFMDISPESENYYRIKITFPDNTYQYTNILPLFDKNSLPSLIYPNPATTKLNIKLENRNYLRFSIADQFGRRVMNGELNSIETIIDISRLSVASYIIKFYKKDGTEEIYKFVKTVN